MTAAPDAVVIGAGIAGASIAAELSRTMTVMLLEAEQAAGYHASGRSAAVFVPNYGDSLIRQLSAASRSHFDAPDAAYWPHALLAERGLLRLVREDGLSAYREQMTNATGVEPISLERAASLFPALRPGRFVEASFERDVHDIDVDALLQGYLRQARANGARIECNARVEGICADGSGWLIDTRTGRYASGLIVNAAGAWADPLAALAAIAPIGMRACRRSVAVMPRPSALRSIDRMPFVVPFPLGWYAKSEPGRLMVSAAEEDPVAPGDAWVDDLALAQGLDRFSQDTGVDVTRVDSHWAGLRTFSPDGHPVIGFDPAARGFYWLAGQGGFGIQTAPAIARLAAADIVGAGACDPMTASLGPARFRR